METPDPGDLSAGFAADGFQLLETVTRGNRQLVKFRKADGESNREVLQKLTARLDVSSFREVIPSMNEVFIQVVEQANQKNKP
jgi:ABC-2 type transport system ATP-binding protein